MSFWDSYNAAYNAGTKRYNDLQEGLDRGARRKAGNALAGGNATEAQNVLNRNGMLGDARDVGQYERQQADVQQASQDRNRKQHAEVILKATDAIRRYGQMKPGSDPMEAFDAVAPLLGQITDPQALAHIREQYARDPDSVLAMAEDAAKQELKLFSSPDGVVGVNPQSGQSRLVYENKPREEYEIRERTNPDTSTDFVYLPKRPGARPPESSAITTESLTQFVQSVAPGARINSGARSPEHNAAVNGVANSFHIPDANGVAHAVDVAPPPGVSVEQFAAQLRAKAPRGVEVIAEPAKNHVHLEPAPSGAPQAGPTSVRGDAAKTLTPGQRQQQARSDRTFAMDLNTKFNARPEVKDFKDVQSSFRQIASLASKPKPTPADDTALTFSFMKMLDPGSVVREGEFALVAKQAGLPDRIVIALGKLDKGQGLTPAIRADLIKASQTVYTQRKQAYDTAASEFTKIATESGTDPTWVVGNPGANKVDVPSGGGGRGGKPAPAPQNAAQRQKGAVYSTPKGPLKWTGTGWVQP